MEWLPLVVLRELFAVVAVAVAQDYNKYNLAVGIILAAEVAPVPTIVID